MTNEATKGKPSNEVSGQVDRFVMCQWFGCDKPATLLIKSASTCVCDEHYLANVLRFGCEFTTEPVNAKGI